jgi:DNA helicase II / ATP-dependent DNA helicase PcrA
MPITTAQKALAEQQQRTAAIDPFTRVRLSAGPGTGKSHCIELRVAQLLSNGSAPDQVYVISFTRATCIELRERLEQYCSSVETQTRLSSGRIQV